MRLGSTGQAVACNWRDWLYNLPSGKTNKNTIMKKTMKKVVFLFLLTSFSIAAFAQDGGYAPRWGISAAIGTLTQQEDGGDVDSRENEGNAFAVNADYRLSRRLALTGGVYAEQTGMLTDYDADGIGGKSFWMAGVSVGAKYYFFPLKWVVQPYVGASAYANVLNLGHNTGSYYATANDFQGSRLQVDYDVCCPAVSLAPQLGADIRLLGSLLLTLAADFRFGLYGKSRADVRHVSGPGMGTIEHRSNPMSRTVLSLGLKMDFPTRPVNWRRAGTTLLDLLLIWINGKN